MRRNRCIASFMCHFDGFQSLRYRTDLIQFDQNRISAAKADTFLKTLCICNKQVITYKLYFSSKFFCHDLPAFPVFLIKAILNRVDWIFFDQIFPVINKLRRCKFLSAFRKNILPLFVSFPLTGCSIHGKYKILSRLISCFFHCFKDVLNGFLIASKVWCKTTFISNACCKAFFFQKCSKSVEYLRTPAKSLFKAWCSCRHDHKFLNINGIRSMCTTV